MSNSQTEYIKKLTQEINRIQQELLDTRRDLLALQQRDARHTEELLLKDQRIIQLESAIEDLEREKWSFQSELENLRGY